MRVLKHTIYFVFIKCIIIIKLKKKELHLSRSSNIPRSCSASSMPLPAMYPRWVPTTLDGGHLSGHGRFMWSKLGRMNRPDMIGSISLRRKPHASRKTQTQKRVVLENFFDLNLPSKGPIQKLLVNLLGIAR